jgi:hypothetical protein
MSSLKNKHVALLGLGPSQLDYHLSITHSQEYDEVWAINAMCAVVQPDRVFMMDPASRFFDSEDAGGQTDVMRKVLPKLTCPIYSCGLDERVPAIKPYPLDDVVKTLGCGYLSVFGVDFTYATNVHYAELGRACCEFWLAKCMSAGMDVAIAPRSPLLDTNVAPEHKLYGYHRLDNPPVVYAEKGELKVTSFSNIEREEEVVVSIYGREDGVPATKSVEPASF